MSTAFTHTLAPASRELAAPATAVDVDAPAAVAPRAMAEAGAVSSPVFGLTLSHPRSTVAVIEIAGELDAATAPPLAELLTPRLTYPLRVVVLDLSAVTFLGVAGLNLLIHAHHQGRAHGCRLRLITGPHAVNRALRIAGLDDELACYPIPP